MEIAKERNFSKLIGKFTTIAYEGEIVNVLMFEDNQFGILKVGVLHSKSIELNVPYEIIVSLQGKAKKYADGKVYVSNSLNLISYERLAETKTEQTKIKHTEGDK